MRLLWVTLLDFALVLLLAAAGCSPAAPTTAPTTAPAPATAPTTAPAPATAPTTAPAAKAVEPAKPAAEPTRAAAPQPTAAPAAKADYPTKGKTITFLVGWAPGGANDTVTRLVAAELEKELGTPVQVVNKPGAGSQIALTELAKSKPDGYTFFMASGTTTMLTYMNAERLPAYSRKDLLPVAQIVATPLALVVAGDSRFKTLKDLVDEARAKPEKVSAAYTAILGPTHLALLSLEKQAGVKFASVEIDSTPTMTTNMMGGHLDTAIGAASNWISQFKAGQLRFLGITDTQESRFYPGVKTMEAQGYKVYELISQGLIGPAGMPKEVVAVVSDAIKKISATQDFKQKLEQIAVEPRYQDAAEFERWWNETEADTALRLKQAIEQQKAR